MISESKNSTLVHDGVDGGEKDGSKNSYSDRGDNGPCTDDGGLMSSVDVTRNVSENSWLWCADYDSPSCLRCCRRFKKLRVHRYHCHCCNLAVCGDCSDRRLPTLPLLRVCFICYNDNMRRYDVALPSGVHTHSDASVVSPLTHSIKVAFPTEVPRPKTSTHTTGTALGHSNPPTPHATDPMEGKTSGDMAWEVVDIAAPMSADCGEPGAPNTAIGATPNETVGAGSTALLQLAIRPRAGIVNRGVLRTRTQGLLSVMTGWKKRCFVLDSNAMLACFTQYSCDTLERVHVSDRFPSAITNMHTVRQMTFLCEQGRKSTPLTIVPNTTPSVCHDSIALDTLRKAVFRIVLSTPSDHTHLLFDTYTEAQTWYSQLCLAGGLCLGCGEPCVHHARSRPRTAASNPPTTSPSSLPGFQPAVVMVELLPHIGRIYHQPCFRCSRRACAKDLTSNPLIVIADGRAWCAESTDDSMDISCFALQAKLLQYSGLAVAPNARRKKPEKVIPFEERLDVQPNTHSATSGQGASLVDEGSRGGDDGNKIQAATAGAAGVTGERSITVPAMDDTRTDLSSTTEETTDTNGKNSADGRVVPWRMVAADEVWTLYNRWTQCENVSAGTVGSSTSVLPQRIPHASRAPPTTPAVTKVGRRKLLSADEFWQAAAQGIVLAAQSLDAVDTSISTNTHSVTVPVNTATSATPGTPTDFVVHGPVQFDAIRRNVGMLPPEYTSSFAGTPTAVSPLPDATTDDDEMNTDTERRQSTSSVEHEDTVSSSVSDETDSITSHDLKQGSDPNDADAGAPHNSVDDNGASEPSHLPAPVPPLDSAKTQVNGGRSGSFMMETPDGRFVLKTISSGELTVLQGMLDAYIEHMHEHPNTLLVRVCGLYELHVSRVRFGRTARDKIAFIVMKNVLDTGQDLHMHRVYDLKGSSVNRRSVAWKQSGMAAKLAAGVTHKDMDLRQPLQLGDATGDVIRQLEIDANFLASLGIMDYSLLVGVHECDDATAESCERVNADDTALGQHVFFGYYSLDRVCASSNAERESGAGRRALYALGIIDILQEWSKSKEAEAFLKSKILRSDRIGISAVNPKTYADRFVSAMSAKFDFEI
eukprot:m.454208 g.454208  ORF g.454208 m.454208 type:complete len:1100 (-) comp21565_c0_seq3:107-3406(-)